MFLLQRSTHATDWTWTSSTANSYPLRTAKHLCAPGLRAKMTLVRARTQFSQLSIRDTRSRQMSLGDFASSSLNSSWRLLKAAWHGVLSISKKRCSTASAELVPASWPLLLRILFFLPCIYWNLPRYKVILLPLVLLPCTIQKHLSLPSLITLH